MRDFETIKMLVDDRGVARLVLNRPDKHNAMNAEMISELRVAGDLLATDHTVRVVVLEGAGKSFCAGGDLNWMREQLEKPTDQRAEEGMKLASMLRVLDDLPQPVIAKVHGNAFGGAVGIMCVADIVIASDHIRWGLTETKLGLIPATIGPYVVRRLGEGPARRCFMNSMLFGTTDGYHMGLISKVVEAAALDDAVEEEIASFLLCAPGAVSSSKALAKTLARFEPDDPMAHTAGELAKRWADPECEEGTSAFFEKRKPAWSA